MAAFCYCFLHPLNACSLLESRETLTKEDVEQAMDGNLCRCTGYRPILDAFKTFGADADQKTKDMVKDIEVRCHARFLS